MYKGWIQFLPGSLEDVLIEAYTMMGAKFSSKDVEGIYRHCEIPELVLTHMDPHFGSVMIWGLMNTPCYMCGEKADCDICVGSTVYDQMEKEYNDSRGSNQDLS